MNFRRSIIIAKLWRPEVARRWKKSIFLLFGNYGVIFKILFGKKFTGQRSTCCVQISWNSADWKSIKSCVIYLTKNSPGSPALVTARIAPEICQSHSPTMYSECSRFHPHRFSFGGVILERVNTVRARSKVNPVFGWSLASSRITNRRHFGSIAVHESCCRSVFRRNGDCEWRFLGVFRNTCRPTASKFAHQRSKNTR